jgi:formylmethanofuran dehydrogenase subunit D
LEKLAFSAHDDAALMLSEGELAQVSSEAGSLVLPVQITDTLPAGVALIPKGRWPKLQPEAANVNVLTFARASDMGASTTVHGLEVTVMAVSARPAVQARELDRELERQ